MSLYNGQIWQTLPQLEQQVEVSRMDTWGTAIQAEGTANTKALP